MHGGYCGDGFYCGIFYVNQNFAAYIYNWANGAALVYQNRSGTAKYSIRGGRSNSGPDSGTFCLFIDLVYSYITLGIGAAISYKFIKIEVKFIIVDVVVILVLVKRVEYFLLFYYII